MICPKCGFSQMEATECARCGVVFAKFQTSSAVVEGEPLPAAAAPPDSLADGADFEFGPVSDDELEHRLRVGSILSEAVRAYLSNFIAFSLISVLPLLPMMAMMLLPLVMPAGSYDMELMMWLPLTIVVITAVLGSPIATAAVTFGVLQHMRGRHASLGNCLATGLRCLVTVILVAILQGLATLVGMLFCIIPGIIIAMMYSVAVPAAVEERPGALAALKRSELLTEGYRMTIFAVLLLLWLLSVAFGLAVEFGLSGVPAMVVRLAGNVVSTAMGATVAAVFYYRLRSARESVDVLDLASVFD